MLLVRHGIIDVPTTSRNPQGNSVCERMHQVVADVLRSNMGGKPFQTLDQATNMLEDALATAVHANRCSFTKALGATPGEVVFGRDMLLDLPIMVDLVRIQSKRQLLIDENLRRQNSKRRE